MLSVDTVNFTYESLLRVARVRGGHDEALFRRLEERFVPADARSEERRRRAEAAVAGEAFAPPAFGHDTAADSLKALVIGMAQNCVFMEVGPDGLVVVAARTDELGVPSRDEASRVTLGWSELFQAPGLWSDVEERSVYLAGGLGDLALSAGELARTLVEKLRPTLTIGLFEAALRFIVVNRLPGWSVTDLLCRAVETRCPSISRDVIAVTDTRSFDEIVDDHLRKAPLRFDYDLVVARVTPATGAVLPGTFPLFVSDAPTLRRTKDTPIMAHNTCRDGVHVVVVARTPGSQLEDRPVVFNGIVPLGANDTCNLVVQLERPGVVTFSGPLAPVPTDLSLRDILAKVPTRLVNPPPASLDVAFVVDLIGADELVAERKTFVRETIADLELAYDMPGTLRVAFLGVTDEVHVQHEQKQLAHQGDLPKVQRADFTDPRRAVAALDAARSFNHPAQDYPCALDEAIESLESLQWRQALSRRCVVIVTSRPPHPERQGIHRLIPSPTDADWPTVLTNLHEQRAIKTLLVQCPTSWRRETTRGIVELELPRRVTEYAESCWQLLGRHGRFQLADTSPEELAATVDGPKHVSAQSIRLPLIAQTVGA